MSNLFYPVMIKLDNQRVVVIGGGNVAARKVQGLLESGAQSLIVVAPRLCPPLQQLASRDSFLWKQQHYKAAVLKQAALVFAATDDQMLNEQISNDARNCDILVCNVSDGEQGSFITPATARSESGGLTVAISSEGSSPGLVKHLKQELEADYLPRYDQAQQLLKRLRADVMRSSLDAKQRQRMLALALSEAIIGIKRSYEDWYHLLYNRTVQGEGEDAEHEKKSN